MDRREPEKRKEGRIVTTLSVNLEALTGVTRDVSASGVFFEVDANYKVGDEISFSVELNTPGGKLLLKCEGEIVRIEPCGPHVGIAVRITKSALEAMGALTI